LPLAAHLNDIKKVLFSSPEVGQAAVLSLEPAADKHGPRPAGVERLDLLAGKSLGKVALAEARVDALWELNAHLSGDGKLLAQVGASDRRRVDVWSLLAGKRVASWGPYLSVAGALGDVTGLAAVDAGHVLTQTSPGDVVLWKVPECRPVHHWKALSQSSLVLSPGRKYAVLRGERSLVLCNLRTGEVRGRFPFPGGEPKVLGFLAGSFRPDGKELAAVLSFGDGRGPSPHSLVRWDATTGKLLDTLPIRPVAGAPRLTWCGEGNLLVERTLLDLKLGVPVCSYSSPHWPTAQGGPDGRFWFLDAAGAGPARLVARALPEEAAQRAAADVTEGRVSLLLKPGTKVTLELGLAGVGDAARRKELELRVRQHLNGLGLLVAPRQPIELRLQVREADTGEKVRVKVEVQKGTRRPAIELVEVPRKRLIGEIAVIGENGKDLLPRRTETFQLASFTAYSDGKEPAAVAASREQLFNLVGSLAYWFEQSLPSAPLARQRDWGVPWPRTIVLGPER
jgi:hypothetical protein